jgi:hemerythrin
MSIEWSDELCSGIEAIDLQHRHIINLLNQLFIAHQSSSDPDQIVICLIELSKALQEHFAFEEALLAESGYKGMKDHKFGHEEISEMINSLTMSAMLDDTDISSESIEKIVKWFKEHLTTEDIKYFETV